MPRVFRSRWRELIAPISLILLALVAFAAFTAPQQSQIGWIVAFDQTHPIVTEIIGPAAGGGGLYVAAMLAIIVIAVALIAGAWDWQSVRPTRQELDLLAIILAWAALPTILLVAVSSVKPVYVERYVTASAPGLALLVGLLASRGYEAAADRWRIRRRAHRRRCGVRHRRGGHLHRLFGSSGSGDYRGPPQCVRIPLN